MYVGMACGCWTWSFLNAPHSYLVSILFHQFISIFFKCILPFACLPIDNGIAQFACFPIDNGKFLEHSVSSCKVVKGYSFFVKSVCKDPHFVYNLISSVAWIVRRWSLLRKSIWHLCRNWSVHITVWISYTIPLYCLYNILHTLQLLVISTNNLHWGSLESIHKILCMWKKSVLMCIKTTILVW